MLKYIKGKNMTDRTYWNGNLIKELKDNEVFVFGSNPEGIHGAGGAKAALSFGAKYGMGRGLSGKTYALVTKNLHAGFQEKSTGIIYNKEGYCSVTKDQIKQNIEELYECAKQNPDNKFLITFQYDTFPNGTPKKSLNGYSSQEMFEMFYREDIPTNIIFHESYEKHFSLKNQLVEKPNSQDEYTFFFNLTSPFSNFHPSKFTYKEYTVISNEQFMMFSKAKTFGDELTATKIISVNEEGLAKKFLTNELTRENILQNSQNCSEWNKLMMSIKKLGREVKNYDEQVWNSKRVKIVLFGAREKFNQNEDLKNILLATGNSIMVEASKYDKIWGIGLCEEDAKKTSPKNWQGLNLLGKVLTQLKIELQNNPTKRPKP